MSEHAAVPTAHSGARAWRRALLGSTATWTVIALVHAAANYTDRIRAGEPARFDAMLLRLLPAYLPWALFAALLYLVVRRHAGATMPGARVARWLVISAAGFYLPQSFYQIALVHWRAGAPWSAFGSAVRDWRMGYWLVDLSLFLTTFTVVVGLAYLRQQREADARQRALHEENLRLRLEVSQQRLAAIRGQLEPHFLFNTLSAIAALVRRGDGPVALDAVQRLGTLLRYAIGTAETEWVPLRDEWAFVRGYLALQQLRHGDRLQVDLPVLSESVLERPIPPLLLQPLVENAVRHDVEGHQAASRIVIDVREEGSALMIEIINTVHPEAEPNPGSGVGLRAMRDRLSLTYGPSASLATGHTDGWFSARLTIPGGTDA